MKNDNIYLKVLNEDERIQERMKVLKILQQNDIFYKQKKNGIFIPTSFLKEYNEE